MHLIKFMVEIAGKILKLLNIWKCYRLNNSIGVFRAIDCSIALFGAYEGLSQLRLLNDSIIFIRAFVRSNSFITSPIFTKMSLANIVIPFKPM